jgi:hypothetical protein
MAGALFVDAFARAREFAAPGFPLGGKFERGKFTTNEEKMHTEYRIKVFDAWLELWCFNYVDDKLMGAELLERAPIACAREMLDELLELLEAGNAPRG